MLGLLAVGLLAGWLVACLLGLVWKFLLVCLFVLGLFVCLCGVFVAWFGLVFVCLLA